MPKDINKDKGIMQGHASSFRVGVLAFGPSIPEWSKVHVRV